MKDMLDIIYNAMFENSVISGLCEKRIKFYTQPETAVLDKSVTIIPLTPPEADTYASDESLTYLFRYQINAEAEDRMNCKLIQRSVKTVMESLGFTQESGGLDEYFEDTKRFVDARRYIGNTQIYDTDY